MTEKNAVKSETVSPARECPFRCVNGMIHTQHSLPYPCHHCRVPVERATHDDFVASSQAIGAAAKEAAENIAGRFDLNDGAVEPVEPEIEAIILQAIEKARTK